jgi:hypothetical protein
MHKFHKGKVNERHLFIVLNCFNLKKWFLLNEIIGFFCVWCYCAILHFFAYLTWYQYILYYGRLRKVLCLYSRSLSPNVSTTFLDFTLGRTFWFCEFTEYTLCIYRKCTGKAWDCKTDWSTGTAHCLFMVFWHFVVLFFSIANDSYFCVSHTHSQS